ncbi:MAG TPA: phage head-tail connector protein [Thermoanaerobaculia bacterium]|nr:phage head-tail connector protein [Thermoanaerobaculia bacterium]
MSIVALTSSRSTALVSLSDVKLWLGISEEDTSEDALLRSLIAVASSAIVGYLKFPLARQRYEETRKGNGKTEIWLSRLPIEPESLTIELDGEEITDWTLESAEYGRVVRTCGWPSSTEANLTFTYHAGYVLPDEIADWSATTSKAAWARSSSPSLFLFECTTAGTTGASEPSWPDETGATVVDGSVAWTARDAAELPLEVSIAAYAVVLDRRIRSLAPAGVTSIELSEGERVSFSANAGHGHLPPNVLGWADTFGAGKQAVAA